MHVNLKKISFLFLAIIIALSAVLFFEAINVPARFQQFSKNTIQFQKVGQAAVSMQEASDYLTDESRLFAITGEWSHLENYFTEVETSKRREKALDIIRNVNELGESAKCLELAMEESKKLEALECKSMKLVVAAKGYDKNPAYKIPQAIADIQLSDQELALDFNTKMANAWLILFSQQYFEMKKSISKYRSSAVEEIFKYSIGLNRKNAINLRAAFQKTIAVIVLIVASSFAFFLIVMFLVINSLYSFIDSIKKNQKLKAVHAKELELLRQTYNEMFDIAMEKQNFLQKQAEHDELTGLINRTAFKTILKALKESQETVAFVMIDVDKFKEINDKYGHPAGDKTLKAVAQILKTIFRSTDYAARIGGDEFAVVLSKCSDDMEKTKRMISEKMESLFNKMKEECAKGLPPTTLSCGIAISGNGWTESLVNEADKALYLVKRDGRNGYKFAD